MDLSARDREMLAGDHGEATQIAMELLVAVGRSEAAPHLIDVESAHIDGCLYHGVAGLDFAKRLVDGGGAVAVPTTLNVSSLDLLHPDLYRGDPTTAGLARDLMDAYLALGCESTWTCAPYQLSQRPGVGAQVAWGESNAIVFANSVLGARTNRYGDFMDICCALTGRAPMNGLHTDEGRLASLVVDVSLDDHLLDKDLTYVLIGHALGRLAGVEVAVLTGLDSRAGEDRLKALGAAAASSGSVALFHAVGVTPEAVDLETVLGPKWRSEVIDRSSLDLARTELTTGAGALGGVSVGTPHMSLAELARLADLAEGKVSKVPFYVNTARHIYKQGEQMGLIPRLEDFGATVVTDTCTYVTTIIEDITGVLMTDSGKLAYYAPANLGVDVAVASLEDCVESAVTGSVTTGAL